MSTSNKKFNNLEKVVETLKSEIVLFNKRYGSNGKTKGLTPRGDIFEKLVYNSFLEHFSHDKVTWDSLSHSSGKDVTINSGGREFHFSLKSGSISEFKNKEQEVSFSSYRTTRFKSLDKKIDYIDSEGNLFDYYLIYFRNENEHLICAIPSYLIKASEMKWNKHTTKTGNLNYMGRGKNCSMRIVSTMSDQLWITMNRSFLNHSEIVMIDISSVSSMKQAS